MLPIRLGGGLMTLSIKEYEDKLAKAQAKQPKAEW